MPNIVLGGPAFDDHGYIPARHARQHENVSPALEWSGVPDTAIQLLLICEAPDNPGGSFLHWLVTDIDPSLTRIAEGRTPPGARTWPNDFDEKGWSGPHPPVGNTPHRYFFRLYALREPVRLPAHPIATDIHRAVDHAALATGTTVGLYQR